MIRWVKKLVQSLLPRAEPTLFAAPLAPDWTELHRSRWQNFLVSDTGKALIARMRAVEYQNAVSATADSMHTAHSAGRSLGFSDSIRWLETLSVAAQQSAPDVDIYSPMATANSKELDDFITRMSP